MFKVLKFSGAVLVLGVAFVTQGQDRKSVSPQARAALGVDSSGEFSLDDSTREQSTAAQFAATGFHAGNSGAVPMASSRQRQSRSATRPAAEASFDSRASVSPRLSARFLDDSLISPVRGGDALDLDKLISNQHEMLGVVEGIACRVKLLEEANLAATQGKSNSTRSDLAPTSPSASVKEVVAPSSKSASGFDVRAMVSGAGVYVSQHRFAFGAAAATAAALGAAAYNRERLPSVSLTGIRNWFSSKFSK